jgi:hypothetical protein
MRRLPLLLTLAFAVPLSYAAPRQHVITFGKWFPVKYFVGPDETKSIDMKVRSLYVDGSIKEFTTGDPHDVTDKIFVVRRAYRINDWLPEDAKNVRWKWQRGVWLMVDKQTGHITHLKLPNFDSYYSNSSWYRDYIAYCGLSDDTQTVYAMVMQLGDKKPLLKKELAGKPGDAPESACAEPDWQRQPMRVTFAPTGGQKMTFAIHGRAADLAPETEAKEDESK